jgi:aminoglycoside phosphotransferase (APT) family kinase protein
MATSSASAAAESRLAALIAEQFARYRVDAHEVLIQQCGSADPATVASRFVRFVESTLATRFIRPRFFTLSVGPVVACEISDARVVVVKVHPRRVRPATLAEMHRVQRHLVARDFPAPVPVAGPVAFDDRWATVDEWLDDRGNDFGSGAMRASAAGLARMIELTGEIAETDAFEPSFMSRVVGARYPEPHSPLFDFTKADPRIEAIDALADRAVEIIDALDAPSVVAHGDWSARNVRFGPDGLRAVYDWDSLIAIPEPIAVGIAAATWRSFGDTNDSIAPDPAEVDAYRAQYEAARHAPFTSQERRAVHAQALHALCYTARCEISLGAGHPVRATGRLTASRSDFLAALDLA